MDQASLNYAEVKALVSGNPLIMKRTELDTEVAKLKMMNASYTCRHYDLEDGSFRTEALKIYHNINLYAQAERNDRMGIKPSSLQLEFQQRYIYSGCYRKHRTRASAILPSHLLCWTAGAYPWKHS